MIRKITFLTFLIFLTSPIFAQVYNIKRDREEFGFSENSFKKAGKSIIPNSIERKIFFQFPPNFLNSTQADKQRLDSLITLRWDESQWISHGKENYIYNTTGNLTQNVYFKWNGFHWIPEWKEDYIYNPDENLSQSIYSLFYSSYNPDHWLPIRKEEYEYDTNNNITQHLSSDWGPTHCDPVPQWTPDWKEEYSYDANDNLIQYLNFMWVDSQWVAGENDKYTYDTSGKLIQLIDTYWQEDTFKIIGKNNYFYDTDGNLIQTIRSSWFASQWVDTENEEYIRDTNGNLTQFVHSNRIGSQWIAEYKTDYTNDVDGNLVQFINSRWEDYRWIAERKYDCTFNDTYSRLDLILPGFFPEVETLLFAHMLTSLVSYSWDANLNDWKLNSKDSLHYSEQNVTVISEIDEDEIKFYPNPAKDYVNIELHNQLAIGKLFSANGTTIKNFEVNGSCVLSTKNLNSGLYFLQLTAKGKVFQIRLMVLQ